MDGTHPAGLRTPSLRRRVTLVVLAVLALMLLAVAVTTDLVLQSRLEGQLRQRLVDRAGIAAALVDRVDARDLARRLEGDGVSVVLTTASGAAYAEGPLAGRATAPGAGGGDQTPAAEPPATPGSGPAPPGRRSARSTPTPPGPAAATPVVQRGEVLSVTRSLSDGSRVTLLADAGDVRSTLDQVRVALVLAALLVLLLAAVVVPAVVGRAVRPLRTITDVARSITAGDRSRRLGPDDPRTDLGATAEAFDTMLDAVVGAEVRAKDSEARVRAFLGDAAHDLRTPLTGVLAATEHVLRQDPPRAEREQTLLTAIREARRASRLVEDMLLATTIEQGLALDRAPVDLRALAEQVAGAQRLASPEVTVDVEVDGKVGGQVAGAAEPPTRPGPVTVSGDADRLHRVLSNLVRNAVQAGAGSVRVVVRPGPGHVEVDVRDDGPGVPEHERERVFERLVRLDEARSGGGSGLGLPIARGLARAHGGDLVCLAPDPAGGPGALFRLRLPAADPAATVTR